MSMRVVSICTGRSNFDQLVVSCKQASKHAHTHTHTHTHTHKHTFAYTHHKSYAAALI